MRCLLRSASACALYVFLLVCAASASAQELVGGWEGERGRGYGFLMPSYSWGVTEEGSFVLRGSGSHLYYGTPEAGGETRVRSPGAALGVAWRWRTPKASFTLGPGYEVLWTTREPAGAPTEKETEHGFTVQGDVFFQATPLTNLNLIASYGHANRYVWVRGGVKRQMTNTDFRGPVSLILGLEGTGQGNSDLRTYQGGGLLELALPRLGGSMQFRAGYSREQFPDDTRNSRPYFGAGFYLGF
jgi:hypothetical protein